MTKRVLIAEAEAEADRSLREGEAEAGYHFSYAVGFTEAKRLLSERDARFDFLVTDVWLKPFQGRDLANHMVGSHPGIKVLFMGKHSARLLRSNGLLPLSAPFLHKPFTRLQLMKRLDELGLKGPSWLDMIFSQSEEPAPSA